MADLQETLGRVIRKERRRRGRTMDWLARRAAVSLVYLGEIEHGKKYPSALVLERLAWALDVPVHDMLELIARELRAAEPADAVARGAADMRPLPVRGGGLHDRLAA